MRIRRRSRSEKLLERIGKLPWWQRAAPLAVPAVGAVVLTGRRRMWRGLAFVASAVEGIAYTIEDAAEGLRDTARKRTGPAET